MAADARATAARVLGRVLAGSSLNQVLPPALEKVDPRDRALLQQLCYGTLRDGPRLQAILDQMLDKPLRERDRDIQGLLLCGLYQLQGMRIPDHAAVSATVAATRALKKNWARGMANALLRRFQRERDALLENLEPAAALSHPAWLHAELQNQWPQQAAAIIAANNGQPPMILRVNRARISRDDYLEMLAQAAIEARPGKLSPEAVILSQARDVAQLPGFPDGLVSVQDEAAQLAAHLLQARAGHRVLDACAAPGGKTCHILELEGDLQELVAVDVDQQRLARVEENLQRLGLSATLLCADAGELHNSLDPESFDRILVDAPCSATGVIRRHPDIKFLRRTDDIGALAEQQLQILKGLWPLLRPGGSLLYATCSVLEQENSRVVAAFLASETSAAGADLPLSPGVPGTHGRQLLPAQNGPDGLFYAVIHKSS
jgi:16S rRNA (cytosine967-C5)-methyltransferase